MWWQQLLLPGTLLGAAALAGGGYRGLRSIRRETLADQRLAAKERSEEIRQAREEERSDCAERVDDLVRQLNDMTRDRDFWRDRALGTPRPEGNR